MALPPQYREPGPALPTIIVPSADRFRSHGNHHDVPFGGSPAMSIPRLETPDDVPPPLPPPRYVPGTVDLPHHPDGMRDRRDYGHAPASIASDYGSMGSSFAEDPPNYKRDNAGTIGDRDEGYVSYSSTERSAPSEFGMGHNAFHFKSPAEIHGDSMKMKLIPSRSIDKSPPRPILSASLNELLSRRPPTENRFAQLPFQTCPVLDFPARFTETSLHSAVSPRAEIFHYGDRSPNDSCDIDHSSRSRSRRNNSDDAASIRSYEFSSAEDMDMVETSRRAASPQIDHPLATQPHLLRCRDVGSRRSPTLCLGTIPQGLCISTSSSASQSNSYMSSMSIPASVTTENSPTGFSSGSISPTCSSSYNTPISLTPSSRNLISGRVPADARTVSSASPPKLTSLQKPGGSTQLSLLKVCKCCPRKPKKFETEEELHAHAAEKQYECSFCGNRFKNKNEAERHQNSLHVRRHAWCCSALSSYDRAFHESANRPAEADTCGYCGDEFPRSGWSPGAGTLSGDNVFRHATEQDWDERIRHMQEVHKFRECNSSKKFYRADHFRQHLKHSHAGTSGKWTNMLENACMMEEEDLGAQLEQEAWDGFGNNPPVVRA
ncbi:hypothetical protein BGZ61DRAFT_486866 [Ilyonectria robusta]|uniref:uncharacterized protein n=1 Tax=Ilyonectria robusta TaxID=1079257 RepID=UPI001E8CD818|nr:uncharacterized protein BGZ61DRAFT_486866 [Ilyonectria robusta]KAH8654800.1 hypothetical protein BGZ61DRAFT_486866 [Ilyonectria robusta]